MSHTTAQLVAESNRLAALYRETTEAADRAWEPYRAKAAEGIFPTDEEAPEMARFVEVLGRIETEMVDVRDAAIQAVLADVGLEDDPSETLPGFYHYHFDSGQGNPAKWVIARLKGDYEEP